MIRIYFDWNIYSNIRNNRSETFSEIYNFLIDNNSSILLTYSPAHLHDLYRSYFNSEHGKIATEKDLEFLGKLTSNHCLCYDFYEKVVYPNIINPIEYFKEIFIDNTKINLCDFNNVFDENDPLGKLWQSYWTLLKSLPSGIDFNNLEKVPKEYQIINDLFKTTKNNNTFGSLMEDIVNLLKQPKEFEKIFKNIRSNSNKDLKIETDNSKWGNPFVYLDGILKKNQLQKSFMDITTETINNSNKKASRFDYFSNYYIQLDMFGFHKDKKISNLLDDASHSFYGAHSDIFVTDDHNTNKKSKALYKQLNISTEVVYSNEFIAAINKRLLINETKRLFEQIEHIIKNSFLLIDTFDDEKNPSRVYQVDPYLFDMFNRMQISEYENSTSLIFYKKQGNYSNFMFWTEIKEVVDKLSKEIGIDWNNRTQFEELEAKEILNKEWLGRLWNFQNSVLFLNYIEHPFGLTLKLEINKPNR